MTAKTPANIYLRWKRVDPPRFLHLVDGRDTPAFQKRFARWMAEGASGSLVRLCFDAEPEAEIERLRAKGAKHLGVEAKRIRDGHVERLVAELAALPVYSQIDHLNDYLRRLAAKGLIPKKGNAPPKDWPDSIPKERRRLYTKRPPRSIWHEQVESDFYQVHTEQFRRDEQVTRDLLREELGDNTARAFARDEVPDEWLVLTNIAHALTCLPTVGPEPPNKAPKKTPKPHTVCRWSKPVWRNLCDYHEAVATPRGTQRVRRNRFMAALVAEFKRSPKTLRQALKGLLDAHLRFLLNSPGRSRWSWFSDARAFSLVTRPILLKAAANNSAAEQNLADLHRAARYDPEMVSALRQFFFPDLQWEVLHLNRALVGKMLLGTTEPDVQLLLDFLLLDNKGKKQGLIPSWMKLSAPGSSHRLSAVLSSTWTGQVAAKRSGKKEAEFAPELAQQAGVPGKSAGNTHALGSFAQRRLRLGLKYPK